MCFGYTWQECWYFMLIKAFANSLEQIRTDKMFDLIWIQTVWHPDMVFIEYSFERVDSEDNKKTPYLWRMH